MFDIPLDQPVIETVLAVIDILLVNLFKKNIHF